MLYQLSYEATEGGQFIEFISPVRSDMMWSIYEIIHTFENFTTMIILQFKYMNYFIYTSHHFTPQGRYELNKLTPLPMCGFIAQLVEHRTGIAEVTGSFQLLKLENLLRWSFFTLIYNRSSNIWIILYILHITKQSLTKSRLTLLLITLGPHRFISPNLVNVWLCKGPL